MVLVPITGFKHWFDRMTSILVMIDLSYKKYVESNGTLVVELDKALYGCVEAAALWFEDIKGKLLTYAFVQNAYDPCVLNRVGLFGKQTTIVLHVDDLFITFEKNENLNCLDAYLK